MSSSSSSSSSSNSSNCVWVCKLHGEGDDVVRETAHATKDHALEQKQAYNKFHTNRILEYWTLDGKMKPFKITLECTPDVRAVLEKSRGKRIKLSAKRNGYQETFKPIHVSPQEFLNIRHLECKNVDVVDMPGCDVLPIDLCERMCHLFMDGNVMSEEMAMEILELGEDGCFVPATIHKTPLATSIMQSKEEIKAIFLKKGYHF